MIVMKFGGTSVQDAESMEQVIRIVKSKLGRKPIVVLSAMGDTTDTLIQIAQLAFSFQMSEASKLIEDVLNKHHRKAADELIRDSLIRKSVHDTMSGYIDEIKTLVNAVASLGELSPRSLDAIASYGERFSTLILCAGLQDRGISAELVDARKLIITDQNFTRAAPLKEPTATRTRQILLPLLERGSIPVTQGFLSATLDGITTTLGRGGSDYSAAIIGSSLDVEVIEIWTDVDGVLTADPKLVPQAQVIETVTFQEASELAYFGAKVLHPSTILPAFEKNIPVHVYNTKSPTSRGTDIVSEERTVQHSNSIKSIAYKKGITVINVYSTRMLLAHGFLKSIFEVFDKFQTPVDLVSTSEVNVSLTIDDTTNLPAIISELTRFSTVTVEHGKAIICVVGEKMRQTPGVAARIFSTIRDVNVNMISQGASEINMSFIVNEEDVSTIVQKLHDEFFGNVQTKT